MSTLTYVYEYEGTQLSTSSSLKTEIRWASPAASGPLWPMRTGGS